MAFPHPKRLIVEGKDDLYSIVYLMKAHIHWAELEADYPVSIVNRQGKDKILNQEYLNVLLKDATLKTIGIMLDADETCRGSYDRIRKLCDNILPGLPNTLPVDGLVIDIQNTAKSEQIRFGVWIMPDNVSAGTLETFLRYLIPNEDLTLWNHAEASANTARELGATYRDCHKDKAYLHTWLAWHDPPGMHSGRALMRSTVLDAKSTHAEPFVRWFRKLYEL